MKDIILIALTSEGCGHCHNLRGNGELGNGRQFGNYDFIKSHINPLQDRDSITLLNLHFKTMAGRHKEISDISKVYIKNDIIYQEKYYPENNKVMVKVLESDKSNNIKKIKEGQSNFNSDWFSFLDNKIPSKIENYCYFFPCFVVFELKDWKQKKNILGLTNAGFTIRLENGDYALEKNGNTLSERNVLPQKLVIEAMTGVQEFKPHKDLMKPKTPIKTESKEVKQVKKVKKEVKTSKKQVNKVETKCAFVIRHYDDE